jgi:asparagine synthase (glutamine-hydrolysing)
MYGRAGLSKDDVILGQPVKSADGRFSMTFSGRIYNHKKIAKQLIRENQGADLHDASDSEVLLAAIQAYGLPKALNVSKGKFALAVYDHKEQALSLARDRVGEKSLYYGFVNGEFVFAADLNAIKSLENFRNPLNTEVLSLYFIHGYIPAPYSIYQGIHKLEAGTLLVIQSPFKEYTTTPYWSMKEIALHGQNNLFEGSYHEADCELE